MSATAAMQIRVLMIPDDADFGLFALNLDYLRRSRTSNTRRIKGKERVERASCKLEITLLNSEPSKTFHICYGSLIID